MTCGRRTASAWCGLALIATALTGPRLTAAGQPVHDVQVIASRFTFEPATIQVIAGESVRLVVRSKDGIHGFAIPKLKIDLNIPDNGEKAMFLKNVAMPGGTLVISYVGADPLSLDVLISRPRE